MDVISMFSDSEDTPLTPERYLPMLPELDSDPRRAFADLHTFSKGLNAAFVEADKLFSADLVAAFQPTWTSKKPFNLAEAREANADLNEWWNSFAEVCGATLNVFRSHIKNQLTALADQITPEPGDEWNLADTVESCTYRSVDCGSGTYARQRAEQHVLHYQTQSLESEMRPKKVESRSRGWTDYEVWVKASPIDIQIAKRRPGLTLIEWVAFCWKKGVNPRVYDPYLPHGFEEHHGIDYQGNIDQGNLPTCP